MSEEMVLFDKAMKSVNFYLKFIGLYVDIEDKNIKANHWFYIYNFIHLNTEVICEILWLIKKFNTGINFTEATYVIPCLTICFIGNAKGLFFLCNLDHGRELIKTLKDSIRNRPRITAEENALIKKDFNKLLTLKTLILGFNTVGAVGFATIPWIVVATTYYSTGNVKLLLPFYVLYPFDYTDVRYYPFAYLHQLWSAWVAVFTLYGPDGFYYTCCAFIHIQFRNLHNDIEGIVVRNSDHADANGTDESFRSDFLEIINRHKQLIRCVDLLETIYSKSNLINVLSSSLLICATSFNIMVIEDLTLIITFTSFLMMSLFQIFVFCYYGDMVMLSSTKLSNAIYNCDWYNRNTATMKDFLFVLIRTQKPCILTAYGFPVINLRGYTRILSTAWSYFALLKTMYHRK